MASSASSNLAQLALLLGKTVRVRVSDRRLVEGELECVDRECNFILGNATEYHGVPEGTLAFNAETVPTIRRLGSAMIPGKHIVTISKLAIE